MTVVRVAIYPVDAARIDELRRSVDDELIPLYRQWPGFESLVIANAGHEVISVSRWDTVEHAEQGSRVAIDWANHAPQSTGPPTLVRIGEEMNST